MRSSGQVSELPQASFSGRLPKKPRNGEVRTREYLTPAEVECLIAAARSVGRQGHRDATMILLAYPHGLRVSELTALRWDQADLTQGLLYVNRLRSGQKPARIRQRQDAGGRQSPTDLIRHHASPVERTGYQR
jgi:integrase